MGCRGKGRSGSAWLVFLAWLPLATALFFSAFLTVRGAAPALAQPEPTTTSTLGPNQPSNTPTNTNTAGPGQPTNSPSDPSAATPTRTPTATPAPILASPILILLVVGQFTLIALLGIYRRKTR